MKPKISTNFVPYTDATFSLKATHIIESMENNPYFSDPVPPLNTIRQLRDDYNAAMLEASTKNIHAIAQKNVLRKELEHQLARLALYVMFIADGDEAIMVSSGYSLTKKPEGNRVKAPQKPTLTSGVTTGQMVSTIKVVKGAKYYLHEITSEPLTEDSIWESHSCSRRKYAFNDLKAGQKYWVRIAVLGTDKQKAYSQPASQWAQ